jgi:hypothetical protein
MVVVKGKDVSNTLPFHYLISDLICIATRYEMSIVTPITYTSLISVSGITWVLDTELGETLMGSIS